MKKKALSMLLASAMVIASPAGCGEQPAASGTAPADTQPEVTTENKTEAVDAAIENAEAKAEDSGYVYEGTAPIT